MCFSNTMSIMRAILTKHSLGLPDLRAMTFCVVALVLGLRGCLGLDCAEPIVPEKGYLLRSYQGGSDVIKYACHEGYRIEGQAENYCMGVSGPSDPYWAFQTPVCIATYTCPPVSIANGKTYTSDGQRYDSEVTVVCDPGYVQHPPLGTRRRKPVCRTNGEWEPRIPVCVIPMCDVPRSEGLEVIVPDFYHREGDKVESSAIANFRCRENYVMYGDESNECLAVSKWRKPVAYCVKVYRPILDFFTLENWLLLVILVLAGLIVSDGFIRVVHGLYLLCKASLTSLEKCQTLCLFLIPLYGTCKLIMFVRNLITFNYQNTKDMAVTIYDDSAREGIPVKLKYKPIHFSSNPYHDHIHLAIVPAEVAKVSKKKHNSTGAIVQLDTELGIRVWLGYVVTETTAYSFVIERPPDRSEQMPLISYCINVLQHPQKSGQKRSTFKYHVSSDDEINMKKVKEWLEDEREREQGSFKWKWTQLYTRKHFIRSYLSHWRPVHENTAVEV